MKIYVAGRYKRRDYILSVYKSLEAKGHTITNKWTDQEPLSYKNQEGLAERYVEEDLEGIRRAEAFLLLAEYELDARGCHVEFGYALREAERRPLQIFVVYEKENPSMFYRSAKVVLKKELDEILKLIPGGEGS